MDGLMDGLEESNAIPEGFEVEIRVTDKSTGKYLKSRYGYIRSETEDAYMVKHMVDLLNAGNEGDIKNATQDITL
ncbi:MAG: hypothetical protein KGL39_47040 [Patescibacteria group bacterium]|nr:hypothetical protein [Patescibacteria group bacterium]